MALKFKTEQSKTHKVTWSSLCESLKSKGEIFPALPIKNISIHQSKINILTDTPLTSFDINIFLFLELLSLYIN